MTLHLEVLDLMPDAVVVTGADGAIRFVNRMVEVLFGWARADLMGRQIEVLVPARFRTAHAAHREGYRGNPRVRPMGLGLELTGVRKDGTEFPVDISLAPLEDEGSSYTVSAIRDITARRQLEAQARALAAAKEEIRERDQVLAIASHELRAPVGSMQLQVGMVKRAATEASMELNQLRERMAGTVAELNGMSERVGKVERHSRRLARLIDDLLDVSHPGGIRLRPEDVDLADLAREVIEGLREEVERHGSQLSFVSSDSPVVGRWDPTRIEQVIANLVLNAAKFGSGKPITIGVDGAHDHGLLTVADEGIGIDPEDQARIFGRFERAAAPGSVRGLGLGLFIADQIVQAHGGFIRVASTPGAGSKFTVDLPCDGVAIGQEQVAPAAILG